MIISLIKNFFFYIMLLLPICLNGQQFFRITGEYSQKGKAADGTAQLTMGNFYFDKYINKIVYENYFPEKETWVSHDTSLYKIVKNSVVSRVTIPALNEMSVFNLVLNNRLDHYGLDNTVYKITDVQTQGTKVISTWEPPSNLKNMLGKVLISNDERRLQGIVFYDTKGNLVRKQFFEEYQNLGGVEFPTRIVEILIIDGTENYQVTTYKNVKIDDLGQDHLYDYTIPVN